MRPAASFSERVLGLLPWFAVLGEFRASRDPDRAPTVLCYGHFDVQPADPLALWDSPPFAPEIRGEHLYGRGVADDKGQLFMLLSAARELARAGQLPVNIRFACDGEEETGGQSIVEFLAADERGADAAVIFDSTMVGPGVPAFNLATGHLWPPNGSSTRWVSMVTPPDIVPPERSAIPSRKEIHMCSWTSLAMRNLW